MPENTDKKPQVWLLSAVIVASTAALLGTSQSPSPPISSEPQLQTTYHFERLAIDGGFVELTRDLPSATFFVTLRADDLGPDGVPSTDLAQVFVQGDVTASDLQDTTLPPTLSITLSSPDTPHLARRTTAAHFERSQDVVFTGNCANPKTGAACAARFRVDVTRDDDGMLGGNVRFDWAFDVTASGTLASDEAADLGPFDPPWSVEISQ